MLNFTVFLPANVVFSLNDLSSGIHGWIDLCWLWKKQGFSCDRGWVVWEGLSQQHLPLGMRKRGYFPSAFVFFLFFALEFSCFFFSPPVFSASFSPSLFLPSHIFSLYNICLFKGRNNHSSSIRRGELDLVILKGTWKAEVVTVCWYWIEQWLWQRFIVSLCLCCCVHMSVCLCL